MALTKENRELFVRRYLHWILVDSVRTQFDAFRYVFQKGETAWTTEKRRGVREGEREKRNR